MPYLIDLTNGDPLTSVNDQTLDSSTSITLVGRNTPNYGEIINENLVHLMENFANSVAPVGNPLVGQVWYDTANDVLRYYTGSAWLESNTLKVRAAPPANNFVEGSVYFDSGQVEAKVFYDGEWIDLNKPGGRGPNGDGTEFRTLFLLATDGNTYAVTGMMDIDENGVELASAVFSQHPAFDLDPSDPYYGEFTIPFEGIGDTIGPGLNLRQDASENALWKTKLSQRSEAAYTLNTGIYELNSDGTFTDNGGDTIDAANVYHAGADSIPSGSNLFDLGSSTSEFAELWVHDIFLSNGITPIGGNVFIGTDANPIKEIFVTDIEIDGNLIIEGDDVTIGGPGAPVSAGYFEDLFVSNTLVIGNVTNSTDYSFPSTNSVNSILASDSAGDLQWYDFGDVVGDVQPGQGINVSDLAPSGAPSPGSVLVEVDAGTGLQFDGSGALEVTLSPFSTSDLSEGARLYFTPARVADMFTDSSTVTTSFDGTNLTPSIPGGRVVGSISDGAATSVNASSGTGVGNYSIDVNVGPGIRINGSNQLVVDAGGIVGSGAYSGGSSTFGTIGVDNNGVITITDLNEGSLNLNAYINTGPVPQSKQGALTVSGVQLFDGSIQRTTGGRLTLVGDTLVNGTLEVTGDVTGIVTTSSDRRLKTGIKPLEKCLETVNKLEPVEYVRKETGVKEIGLVAQDVQQVLPDVVRTVFEDEDGESYLGVQYANMVSVLIGATKELTETVYDQKNEIRELRAELNQLRSLLGK